MGFGLHRLAHPIVIAALCAPLSACLEAESRRCSWGAICPPGMQCHDDSEQCILPTQLETCVGQTDGQTCEVAGQSADYLCLGEVCLRSVCGDGQTDERSEACDDGNTFSGDGCRADCLGAEICGDGQIDELAQETCDDGHLLDPANQDNEDGCTERCLAPYCGDGLRTGGEACDAGDDNSDTEPDACRRSCRLPGCGDQVEDAGERGRCWLLTGDGRQATGPTPLGLAVGDLNGDTLPDLAVVSHDASSVSVFLSNAQGGLEEVAGSPFYLGHPPTAAAIGDLGGDTIPDVVVVCDDGHLARLTGDGAGGLSAPIFQTLTARFSDVIVADLTGDGDPEVLATDQQSDALWVLRPGGGDPLEVVATASVGASGVRPVSLAAADFDGDGNLEVAVANRAFTQLSLLSADAAGDLSLVAGFPRYVGEHWSSSVGDVHIADANADGHLDLVWLDVRPWSSSWLGTLLGDGALGFTPDASGLVEVGPGATTLASGDLDADGQLDLVAPSITTPTVYLLLGGGDRPFTPDPGGPVALQARSRTAAIADFDGDGLLDLVLADYAAGYVDLYLNAP